MEIYNTIKVEAFIEIHPRQSNVLDCLPLWHQAAIISDNVRSGVNTKCALSISICAQNIQTEGLANKDNTNYNKQVVVWSQVSSSTTPASTWQGQRSNVLTGHSKIFCCLAKRIFRHIRQKYFCMFSTRFLAFDNSYLCIDLQYLN